MEELVPDKHAAGRRHDAAVEALNQLLKDFDVDKGQLVTVGLGFSTIQRICGTKGRHTTEPGPAKWRLLFRQLANHPVAVEPKQYPERLRRVVELFESGLRETPSIEPEVRDALMSMLARVYDYPSGGGSTKSWAVKESAVIKGLPEQAVQYPGLGIALFTTELGRIAFGAAAQPNLTGCIRWAINNLSADPPRLFLATYTDPVTSAVLTKADLRHTISLAIILARFGIHKPLVDEYVSLVLDLQNSDGGWPAGKGQTTSEVMTALYALEFLSVVLESTGGQGVDHITHAKDAAVRWLCRAADAQGLWRSGVFDGAWDCVLTTSWVLTRSMQVSSLCEDREWTGPAASALTSMVRVAGDETTWNGSTAIQRFRLCVRAAAAVALTRPHVELPTFDREVVEAYINDWQANLPRLWNSLDDEEQDLATATFAARALAGDAILAEVGHAVVASSRRSGPTSL